MSTVTVTPRRIVDGLHRIGGCVIRPSRFEDVDDPPDWYEPGTATHGYFNAYLLSGEKTLLWDTTPPSMRAEVLEALSGLLDDGLDYIAISHPEAPHGGNAEALIERYGADLIVPADPLHGHALDPVVADRLEMGPGDTLDLGDRTLEFVDPPLFDLAATNWLFDHGTGALFTVDAFVNGHLETECGLFTEEIADDPDEFVRERWVDAHTITIPWLAYADPERLISELEDIVETYEPRIICPSHGSGIRTDAVEYIRRLYPVIEEISERSLGQEVRV